MNIGSNSHQNTDNKCKVCKLFFGSQAFKGLCSSCFKKQKVESKEDVEKLNLMQPQVKPLDPVRQQKKPQPQTSQIDKTKCYSCSRKLGMLGTQCRCSFLFCNKHKMPEDHKCSFNYGQEGVQKLKKELIKSEKAKINKIE